MSNPNVGSEYFTERDGINIVSQIVNDMRCIWRETTNKDVGIDGQVEYVDDNSRATGHLIAVQVKSGKSYIDIHNHHIVYYPEEKHRRYWEFFPIPVILIIYDPEKKVAYWEDVRRYLRLHPNSKPIRIPLNQTLDTNSKARLFESCGTPDQQLLTTEELLAEMLRNVNKNTKFRISFFDIFVNGLTDLGDLDVCRKLFFSFGLCMQIAHAHAVVYQDYERKDGLIVLGLQLGKEEGEFIDKYIRFLVAQNIASVDFSDYLSDYYERGLVPIFICPLTSRGIEVVRLIKELEDRMAEPLMQVYADDNIDEESLVIVRERVIIVHHENYEEMLTRFAYIKSFKEELQGAALKMRSNL